MSELLVNDGGEGCTVLVPTNKAVMALAKKPHQGPAVAGGAIQVADEERDAESRTNVERWVASHIIPRSPIDLLGETEYETLLPGKSLRFVRAALGKGHGHEHEHDEWTRVLLNGDIRILSMKQASNGVLYLIDGTISPSV